jgi:two-component system catabolic regulation response regulator CreB
MVQNGTVLVVEDEPAIAESVAYALRREGFLAILARDLHGAWERRNDAHIVLLDLMLPDGSGFDLISRVRAEGNRIPIIVVSSRDSERDRVNALESGADDYVTKPFSPREVVARVRAVLRRFGIEGERVREPTLRIEAQSRRAFFHTNELELTRVEFDLLSVLAEVPGKVFGRTELIDRVWGAGFAITDRTIDSHVKSLRRKVSAGGGSSRLIETVRGVGYRVRNTREDELESVDDEPLDAGDRNP